MDSALKRQETPAPSPESLIAAARGLVPYLRGQAGACESARRVSSETIARLHEAGLFNVPKPRRYGGYQMGWDVFSEIIMTVASGCGSSGWIYGVVGAHAAVVARFGVTLMDEIWLPNPNALISSCRRGAGILERVEGGFRGTLKGMFSSGCLNADWVIIDGAPVAGEERPLTVVVPMSQVEVLDTWRVMGLAGTGSNDLIAHDVFIPEHRTWFPGKAPHGGGVDGAIFRTPFLGGPLSLPSVVLGVALGGLELFSQATAVRASSRGGGAVADLQSMQIRIGESALEIDAARSLVRAKLRDWMAQQGAPVSDGLLPAGGAAPDYDQGVAAFVANSGYNALNRLMSAAGANQLALSEPFQRCFRDALAGAQQPSNNWDNGRTVAGRRILDTYRSAKV